MKYNKLIILLVVFAVFISISTVGSVSAASTGNNSTHKMASATSTTPNTAIETNTTGQSKYKGPQTNNTKWTNSSIYSRGQVTVTKNGTMYAVYSTLYAFDSKGTLLWTFDPGLGSAFTDGAPVVGEDGIIYFVIYGNLYAINSNGTQKWVYHTGSTDDLMPGTAVMDSKGVIYFTTARGNVYAIDTNTDPTGTDPKWVYSLTGDIIRGGASLSADEKTLYFGTSTSGTLYAINTADKSLKWSYTTGSIRSTPIVGSDGTIYVTYSNGIYAFYANGTVKWNYTSSNSGTDTISPVIAADGTVYAAISPNARSGYLYAFNSDGSVKWTYNTVKPVSSTPVIGADGTIYLGTTNGKLYALYTNGTSKWNYTASGSFGAPTIGPDSTLYIGNTIGFFALQDLTANFTTTSDANPSNVQFNDTSSNIPTSWSWDFGDGTTSTEQNPTHNYTNSGKYTVTLTVTNTYGDTNTTTQEITVIKDTTAPTVTTTPASGTYKNSNITLTAVDDFDQNSTIYYSLDNGVTWHTATKTITLHLNDGVNTIQYYAEDLSGNKGTIQTTTYTIDTQAPTANADIPNGTYNTNKIVTITMNENGTIYYTLNGSNPSTSSTKYTGPITINSTTTLKFIAVDNAGNSSPSYTTTYTIDKKAPTATTNVKSGTYNTNKTVTLTMNEPGTIYYTLNGSNPTTNSTRYTKPITITSTKTLKFIAIDKTGNKSSIYTVKYVMDKAKPYVSAVYPKKNSTGISRTNTLYIKFNENIKNSINWSKVYIKNLKTGKNISVNKVIKNNTLYLKTGKRSANTTYQIYIPTAAIKDIAGNNATSYTWKFKTGTK